MLFIGVYLINNFSFLNKEIHPVERLEFLSKYGFNDFDIIDLSNQVSYLSKNAKIFSNKSVKIQPFVTIDGPIFIGEGSSIGPYSFLRGPLYIGKNVKIGPYCELTRSIIMDNSVIAHKNIVPDSVIENDVWISGTSIICNTRLDKKEIKVLWNNIEKYTNKFGVLMGEFSKLGAGVYTMPGTYVTPYTSIIGPSSIKGIL